MRETMDDKLRFLYDSLISILGKEIEVCGELCDFLVHEKDMLKGASADKLDKSNAMKEACISRAGMLEDARKELVRKIAKVLNLEDNLTISALLPYAEGSRRGELAKYRSLLRSLLKDIQKLNEDNKMLLSASLSRVRRSIGFLGQLVYPGTTYLNSGKLRSNNINGKILSREG